MRTFRQRVWVSALVIVCGLAAGGCAGYVFGRALTLKQSEARLEQYAIRIIDEGERSTTESRKVLGSMNASSYAKCSDAEISYFSNLIYASQYLKAAGRIHDGRIQCATPFGRVLESTAQYKPDIQQRDGTFLYRNLAPFQVGKELVIAIQKERAVQRQEVCLRHAMHAGRSRLRGSSFPDQPGDADQSDRNRRFRRPRRIGGDPAWTGLRDHLSPST